MALPNRILSYLIPLKLVYLCFIVANGAIALITIRLNRDYIYIVSLELTPLLLNKSQQLFGKITDEIIISIIYV